MGFRLATPLGNLNNFHWKLNRKPNPYYFPCGEKETAMTTPATGSAGFQTTEETGRETNPVTSQAAKALQKTAAVSGKVDLDKVFISKSENIRGLGSNEYSDESIGEMAAQIEAVGGLLQPIGVCKVKPTADTEGKDLMLVWGYRRAFALQYLAETDPKWAKDVPARMVEKGTETVGATRIIQLMENTARKDLNPMETAQAIHEALNDKQCDFNQQDIARMLGMSTPAVSQHLKLLRFPKNVQEAVSSGNLTFSHAREILSRVPETAWATAAKKASGMTFGAFGEWLDKEYPADDSEGDGEVTASGEKSSSQKPAKMLRATDVSNKYVKFLEEQVGTADKNQKTFTAADVAQARLDTVKTILLNPDTQLAKDIDPFLKKLEAQEAEEKAHEEANKAETNFFKEKVKRIEELYDVPVDPTNPNAERPKLTQVYAQVGKEIFSMSDEDKAKLGFALPATPDELVNKLATVYTDTVKARAEAKKKRDEAKAKKQAEETAKAGAAAPAQAT
jgi:ParB/RepB/Spo0J family partition protein